MQINSNLLHKGTHLNTQLNIQHLKYLGSIRKQIENGSLPVILAFKMLELRSLGEMTEAFMLLLALV